MKNKNDKNNEIVVDGRTLTLIVLTSNKARGYLDRLFDKYKSDIYENVRKKIKETKYVAEAGEIDLAFRTRKAIRVMNLLEFRNLEAEKSPTDENIRMYEEINRDITTAVMSLSEPLKKANREKSLEVYYEELEKAMAKGNEEDLMIEMAIYGLLNAEQNMDTGREEHDYYRDLSIKLFKYFSHKEKYEIKDIETAVRVRKSLGLDSVRTLGDIYRKIIFFCENEDIPDEICDLQLFIGHITQVCNLDFDRFKNSTISRKEMNEIIDLSVNYSPAGIREKELIIKIYIGAMLYIVEKAFDNDRKLFFENTDAVYELENKIAEINEKEKLQEIEQLKNTISNKDAEIERLRNELRSTSLEYERSKAQKSEEIENLEELLIEAYKSESEFTESEEYHELEVSESEYDLASEDIIIDQNIFIVGGYPSLINKLRERMPNINWICKERQIKGNERNVFLLANLVGHGMRYRMDSMSMEYIYVNGTSPNIIAREIYEHLLSN